MSNDAQMPAVPVDAAVIASCITLRTPRSSIARIVSTRSFHSRACSRSAASRSRTPTSASVFGAARAGSLAGDVRERLIAVSEQVRERHAVHVARPRRAPAC